MPVPSPLGESVREALDALDCVLDHPAGHSQTLLRYLTPGGVAFGIQRVEITSVRFWAAENEGFAAAALASGLEATLHVPPSKSKPGRNSSLDQIPGFKGRPLHWVAVSSPAQAVLLFGLLVATTTQAAAPVPGEAERTVVEATPEPVADKVADPVVAEPAVPEPAAEPEKAVEPVRIDAESVPVPVQAEIEFPDPKPSETEARDAPVEPARPAAPAPLPRRDTRPLPVRLIGGLLGAVLGRGKRPGA